MSREIGSRTLCVNALILGILLASGGATAQESPEPAAAGAGAAESQTVFSSLEGEALANVLEGFKADVMALVQKNEKVGPFATSMGKDRWLFYGGELKLKASTADDYLKAVPALVDLSEQLKSVGVELIYVPITAKWAIYPDAISDAVKPDAQGRIPRVNPESRALFEALRARGVTAVDLTEAFVKERYGEHGVVHFQHDTHWGPGGMVVAAKAVADVIRSRPWYKSIPKLSGLQTEWRPVTRNGDLREFMGRISGANDPTAAWPIETRDARYVSGVELRDDALAVIIGDSNIAAFPYDFNFSAQLAYELKMNVDEVATPVEGCRRQLGRKGFKDPACLLSKKVVIWLHSGRYMAGAFSHATVVGDKHRRLFRSRQTGAGREEKQMLQSKPDALWPLDDPWGPVARDLSGNERDALYEPGVTLSLRGQTATFAGGRVFADLPAVKDYTVELWLWNGKTPVAPDAAGAIWGIVDTENPELAGDHLVLGTAATLAFSNGRNADLSGKTKLKPETWHHVTLVREIDRVACYLNGKEEFGGKAALTALKAPRLYLGARVDKTAPWHGKLSEAAFFARALASADVAEHFKTWLPRAVAHRDLAVEIDPAAGLDSITLNVDDVDDSPEPTTVLSRIIGRSISHKKQSGEALTLEKLVPGTLDLTLGIEFTTLGNVHTDKSTFALRVLKNPAAVDTDVTWSGGGVLPSGRTANEWWRGRNWQEKQPPQFDTRASIIFENDGHGLSRLARDRSIGSLIVRNTKGNHTTELGGNTLAVNGDLSIDLPSGGDNRYTITNGTLRLGSNDAASSISVRGGTLHLDATLDMVNVKNIMLPGDGSDTGTLALTGAGAVSADSFHIASASTEKKATGSLAIPQDSRLEKIAVRDSFRIAAAETPEWRTALQNGYNAGGGQWMLPGGIDFVIGSKNKAADLVAIGNGQGGSKRGSLTAGAGGTFFANMKSLQIGTMSGPGTGWGEAPQSDVAAQTEAADAKPEAAKIDAESIDPKADAIRVEACAMQLDAKRDNVDVKSIVVTGSLATSSGTLILRSAGVVAADTFHVASPGRATLAIPEDSRLKKIIVRDSFRMAAGTAQWATSLKNGYDAGGENWMQRTSWGKDKRTVGRGVGRENWMLPAGISFEIGAREKPASEFTLGTGGGWSSRGCLIAGAGGAFTANVARMELGTIMNVKGGNWWNAMQPEVRKVPPYSVGADHWGILDLSRMERCDITADTLRVGCSTDESWGAQLIGQLLLPKGNVKADTVTVGHAFLVCTALFIGDEEWDNDAFRVGTEGRLEMNSTVFEVSKSIAILNTGIVNTRVAEASSGLDLAADATISIDGKGALNIVFQTLPNKRGLYYGLRWEGDHQQVLEKMIEDGIITLNTDALGTQAGKASVFIGEEQADGTATTYTYIGFCNAPDSVGNNFWGTLDISRMTRCDITADTLRVGHTAVKSWGTQLIGKLLLPRGTVNANTVSVGHAFPVSEERGSEAFRRGCEGRLALNGTDFKVGSNISILNTGIVDARVSEASCGLDLAADATLAIEGNAVLNIVFETLPTTAGLYYGFRWQGDHKTALEKMIQAGVITVSTDAFGKELGNASVFTGKEKTGGAATRFTYIGFRNAPRAKKVAKTPAATGKKDAGSTADATPTAPGKKVPGGKDQKLTVTAEIAVVSKPPVPRAEPYADALTTTLYKIVKVERGWYEAREFLAIEPVMKDYKLLPAAKHKVGDVHRLVLIPWEEKIAQAPKIEKVCTLDDTDNYAADIFWVESLERRR